MKVRLCQRLIRWHMNFYLQASSGLRRWWAINVQVRRLMRVAIFLVAWNRSLALIMQMCLLLGAIWLQRFVGTIR